MARRWRAKRSCCCRGSDPPSFRRSRPHHKHHVNAPPSPLLLLRYLLLAMLLATATSGGGGVRRCAAPVRACARSGRPRAGAGAVAAVPSHVVAAFSSSIPSAAAAARRILRGTEAAAGARERCAGFLGAAPPFPFRAFAATSTSAAATKLSIDDTPLGRTKEGSALLDGLDVYEVPASGDGHPLAVYGIGGGDDDDAAESAKKNRRRPPILMLHGRTWSSVPVFHLLGGPTNAAKNEPGRESRSLMEALHAAGLQPYCMDFRGFGGTPRDSTGWVEPHRCVADVESAVKFITERHGHGDGGDDDDGQLPALMGWSQGALVAQLAAQRFPHELSKLILYGSIYDPHVRYPRSPLYVQNPDVRNETIIHNEFDAAIEDFTVEGSIPPEPARMFAEAALMTDPIKAAWNSLHEFNNCDPARVNVPTLVVAGDQDPYAPLRVQSELFANLGRGADRSWSIIADADHAVHMLDGRAKFVKIVKGFVEDCG